MLHRPFQDADWIWYGTQNVDIVNAFMQARRIFRLKKIPGRAELCVTADARYSLYVNGRFVTRGPARGFQKSWPFDRVDVAPYLRKGNNVLAALVHSLGISNFQYLHQGWAGFILAGRAGGMNLATGPDWKVRRAPGYRRVLARLSAQLGFQEFFDARLDDGSWTQPAFDDTDWRAPSCYPSGQLPWPAFEERGLPLLSECVIAPQSAAAVAAGRSCGGYEQTNDVVRLYCAEHRRWTVSELPSIKQVNRGADELPAAMAIVIPRTGRDRYYSVVTDFGHEAFGCVRVSAAMAHGGEIIDLIGCEGVRDGAPIIKAPLTLGDRTAIGGRVVLRAGKTGHELFAPWGLRYLVVTARNVRRPMTLTIGLKGIGYPVSAANRFACSDERLNAIFEVCLRTQRACMLDAYVDCPWREQAQWFHDARIQAMTGFPLTGSAALFRRAILQTGQQTSPERLVFALAPSMGFNHIMPDYTFAWVMSFRDYYRQSGDLDLFRQLAGVVRANLDYYGRWVTKAGLIAMPRQARGFWTLLPSVPACERERAAAYSTMFNFMYLGALQAAAGLFRRSGDKSAAMRYQRLARTLQETIVRRLYDERHERFGGGMTAAGRLVPDALISGERFEGDPFASAWAILLDVLPERRAALARHVLSLLRAPSGEKPAPLIWFLYYAFEALKKTGHAQAVLTCIRQWWWDYVIARGLTTTPEGWGRFNDGSNSHCHAWGAHPILALFRIGVGIWQTGIACKAVRFAPDFTQLEWARGSMTTPLGKVHAAWAKTPAGINIRVKAPRDMNVQLELPGYKKTHRGPFSLKLRLPYHNPGDLSR